MAKNGDFRVSVPAWPLRDPNFRGWCPTGVPARHPHEGLHVGVTRVLADQWVAVLGLGCLVTLAQGALDPTICEPHFPHPFFSRFLIGRYPLGKWERRRFFTKTITKPCPTNRHPNVRAYAAPHPARRFPSSNPIPNITQASVQTKKDNASTDAHGCFVTPASLYQAPFCSRPATCPMQRRVSRPGRA